MLKRKIISQLEEWKNNHSHEALLIKGARQVGKTTIVRAFAKDNYTHFVEINFEKRSKGYANDYLAPKCHGIWAFCSWYDTGVFR